MVLKGIFVLFLSASVFAADFTVSTAVTTEQVLPDSNDIGTITASGSITVSNTDCVQMNSNSGTVTGQQVVNNGTLSVTDGAAISNTSGGNNAVITNNGTINPDIFIGTARGIYNNGGEGCTVINNGTIAPAVALTSIYGIENTGASCTIINNGPIAVTGAIGDAIRNTGASTTITNNSIITITGGNFVPSGMTNTTGGNGVTMVNNGTILVTNGRGTAMLNFSNNSLIINNGTVTHTGTSGGNSAGIRFAGTSSSLVNNGTVTTSVANVHAVIDVTSSCVIDNRGMLSTSETGADVINSTGNNLLLINSGTIKTLLTNNAINFTGANPTLSLKRGSNIQGIVNSDNALNLIVERGLNLRLTIEELNGFGTITTSMPYVTVGNTETISTVDQSSFAMQSDIIEDLSDSILDAIYRNQDAYLNCCFPCSGAWVAGIGSSRIRNEYIEVKNWQGGFLVGYDKNISGQNALGLFMGGSSGTGRVENNTASAETQSYFGGATYEQLWGDTFFGAAMAGGYYSSKNRRQVMYNLAPGGEETARSNDYGGMFTTEIYAARWFLKPGMSRPLLTAALRYAGLYLGSYSEKDSSANLSVQSRNISLIKPKLLLNFVRPGKFWKLDYTAQPYIGVAGRFQVSGDQVNGELLNQSISFDSTAPKNAAELLYGLYGSAWSQSRCSLFFHFQGLRDSASSSRFLGEGGINYQF